MKHGRVAVAVEQDTTEPGQQIDRKSDGQHFSGDELAINSCHIYTSRTHKGLPRTNLNPKY